MEVIKYKDMHGTRRKKTQKDKSKKTNKKVDKRKYVREYKRQLTRSGHPKETSKVDINALPDSIDERIDELERDIQKFENLYGPYNNRVNCGRWHE